MRKLALVLLLTLGATACSRSERLARSPGATFQAWDLYLEAEEGQLAAWQAEMSSQGEPLQIVGVEGGDGHCFQDAPFYDPAALAGGRLLLAAFDTEGGLPPGRHRVATLHVRRVEGPEAVELTLQVAAGPDGTPIPARADLRPRSEP